jgi:hypothetical protein
MRSPRTASVFALLGALALPACAGSPSRATEPAPEPDAAPDATSDAASEVASEADSAPADAVADSAAAPDASPPATCPHGGPVAFPGAEGFGACATGGRGGRAVHVTNLAASGVGSLQAALDESGARTIVFDVSGVVAGTPILSRGDVTLAGETSPGGVILRGLAIQGDVVCEQDGCPLPVVAPSNVIVRGVRLRPAGIGDDGLRLHRAKNVIVDHVSIANASDEAVQISLSSDVTIQDTMLAETLVQGHAVEYGGMLINYSDPTRGYPLTRLSIHHDLWNRIAGRLPELSRENFRSDEGKTSDLELATNLYWDPRYALPIATHSGPWSDGAEVYWRLNLIDNVFVVGPTFPYGMLTFGELDAATPSRFFLSGNRLSRWPALADWQLAYCCNDFPQAAATSGLPWQSTVPPWATSARFPFASITYDLKGQAALVAHARAHVGAFPRDPMDRRLLAPLATGVFDEAPLDQNPADDALKLDFTTPPAPPADADRDGIPDAWESTHTLDPHDPTDAQRVTATGYTNLERYLFDRMNTLIGP